MRQRLFCVHIAMGKPLIGWRLFLFSLHIVVHSQDLTGQTISASIDNLVPPSPNVSALNKFGNIPVGLSTGIPEISVPVFTYGGAGFSPKFSISLDYHAGGIRVDEVSSNIGLGWALNAGGVISRTLRGLYDELPDYGFFDSQLPQTPEEGNTRGVQNSDRTLSQMYSGVRDSQNDLFNFNFNGRSGRFVLGKNNDYLVLAQQRIRIEKFIGSVAGHPRINRFVITDEYGMKYEFSDYEMTQMAGDMARYFTSSWYLSKICSPAGAELVRLEYEDSGNIAYVAALATSEALPIANVNALYRSFSTTSGPAITGKRIKRVIFTNGSEVFFNYSTTQRQDLSGDYLLEKITIKGGNLEYGYILHQNYVNGRPFLVSVTPFGDGSRLTSSPYLFEYNSTFLPARLSVSQDHWGYPNANTGSLFPHEWIRAAGGALPGWRELPGGTRDTDPEFVKAGSLTKITYPTGGYTIFEMEANTAKDNWLEQNDTVTIQRPPYTNRSMVYGLNSDKMPAAEFSFQFQGANNTSTNFEVSVNPIGGDCQSNCGLTLEFYNPSGNFICAQEISFTEPLPDPYHVTKTFSIYGLLNGSVYKVRAYVNNISHFYNYLDLQWREVNEGGTSNVVLHHVQPYVGGLRARRIIDYNNNSSVPAYTKEYEYVLEDGVTSSGSLGFRPTYSYQVYYDYKVVPSLPEEPSYHGNFDYNYIIRNTSTINDITYIHGSPVTYKRVVEKIGEHGHYTGKTVRYFTSFADVDASPQDVFPSVPVRFSPWYYGQLTREEVFDSSSVLIRKTENFYDPKTDLFYYSDPSRLENFRSISIAPVKFLWSGNDNAPGVDPSGVPHYFLMTSFAPHAGRSELVKTSITNYFSGKAPVIQMTNYVYDQQNFYLKETTKITSNKKTVKTLFTYPPDLAQSGSNSEIYKEMISPSVNMISHLIEEKVLVDGVQTKKTIKEFSKWNARFFAPKLILTQGEETESTESRIEYLAYDSNGSPLSVQKKYGSKTCYLWGYGGDRLVAQIDNAEYSIIQSILSDAKIQSFKNNKTPTIQEVEEILAPLRSSQALKASNIRSFTYNELGLVVCETDSKGYKIYYEYDDFQRPFEIRDYDGKVLKKFRYNYQTTGH